MKTSRKLWMNFPGSKAYTKILKYAFHRVGTKFHTHEIFSSLIDISIIFASSDSSYFKESNGNKFDKNSYQTKNSKFHACEILYLRNFGILWLFIFFLFANLL